MVLFSLLALAGAAIAAPATKQAPASLPMPDIEAITSVPQSSFKSYKTGGLHRGSDYDSSKSSLSKRDGTADGWVCNDHSTPIFTQGDPDDGGRGLTITNAAAETQSFYIYHNTCDNIPWKYISIAPNATQFVSFPERWEGRVTRGVDSDMLNGQAQSIASWLEISWDVNNAGWIDVSLIRGCDGGILTWDLGNGNAWKGFTQDVLSGAPGDAFTNKPDGASVLMATENWDGSINTSVDNWLLQQVGPTNAYIDDHNGNPVFSAPGSRIGSYWPEGRP